MHACIFIIDRYVLGPNTTQKKYNSMKNLFWWRGLQIKKFYGIRRRKKSEIESKVKEATTARSYKLANVA